LSFEEEKSRLVPVVKEAVRLGVPISVDTYKPELMQVMLDLGVDIINDIWSLRWRSAPDGLDGRQVIASNSGCGLCVMHMHREPSTMQLEPMGGDVISQVLLFLEHTIQDLKRLGIDLTRIVIDPGIGFGKTITQNFALLKYQREFLMLGQPLLCGWSRKSSLAAVLGDISQHPFQASADPRMIPSVAAALLAVERGASIVRVHDVLQTVQALKVLDAINSSGH
jgi:dihydropteroate synthase